MRGMCARAVRLCASAPGNVRTLSHCAFSLKSVCDSKRCDSGYEPPLRTARSTASSSATSSGSAPPSASSSPLQSLPAPSAPGVLTSKYALVGRLLHRVACTLRQSEVWTLTSDPRHKNLEQQKNITFCHRQPQHATGAARPSYTDNHNLFQLKNSIVRICLGVLVSQRVMYCHAC